jgi:hypothetical protein
MEGNNGWKRTEKERECLPRDGDNSNKRVDKKIKRAESGKLIRGELAEKSTLLLGSLGNDGGEAADKNLYGFEQRREDHLGSPKGISAVATFARENLLGSNLGIFCVNSPHSASPPATHWTQIP